MLLYQVETGIFFSGLEREPAQVGHQCGALRVPDCQGGGNWWIQLVVELISLLSALFLPYLSVEWYYGKKTDVQRSVLGWIGTRDPVDDGNSACPTLLEVEDEDCQQTKLR